MSEADRVSVSMRGHVGLILMQDQTRHNALASAQVKALLWALQETRRLQARVVVIASGVKNFCAGADIDEMLTGGWLEGKTPPDALTPLSLFRTLINESRPVIAAVNGLALGGGVELLLSSDIVLAAPDARFAMPEIGLGVLPRTALMFLPEIIGRRNAMELILTRRRFAADEALALGLVNRVVDADVLIDTALEMGNSIAECPPTAIAAVKRNLGRTRPGDWEGFDALLHQMSPEEWQEGFAAFLAKRSPDYDPLWKKSW